MKGFTNATEEFNENFKSLEQLVNYTMLYDYGDECIDITGGWTGREMWISYTSGFFEKQSNCLFYGRTSTSSYGGGAFFTANSFDVSEYVSVSSFNNVYAKTGTSIDYYWAGLGFPGSSATTTNPDAFIDITAYGNVFRPQNVAVGTNFFLTTATSLLDSTSKNILKTNCRVAPMAWCGGSTSQKCSIKTYSIWLNKSDNIQGLIERANITATTIDEILTNSEILLNNESAVNYMIKQCTGDFMTAAIQNSTFLTALNNSPYASLIYANEHWAKFLGMVS